MALVFILVSQGLERGVWCCMLVSNVWAQLYDHSLSCWAVSAFCLVGLIMCFTHFPLYCTRITHTVPCNNITLFTRCLFFGFFRFRVMWHSRESDRSSAEDWGARADRGQQQRRVSAFPRVGLAGDGHSPGSLNKAYQWHGNLPCCPEQCARASKDSV